MKINRTQNLLAAAFTCALASVTVARAVADTLDCPIPPLGVSE